MTPSTTYADKPWLASYEEGVPAEIDYEDVCLPVFLERSAADFPETMALLFQGYQVNFRDLNEMVNRCAAGLQAMGSRMATLSPLRIPRACRPAAKRFTISSNSRKLT